MNRPRPTAHSLVQLIKLAEMATRNLLEQRLRPFRLSSGQLLILVRVEREGQITPAELARGLYQTPQSLGRLYPPLIRRGLLQRQPDASNQRRVLLSLTDEAKALLPKVRDQIEPLDVDITDLLGPEASRQLEASLLRLL